LSPQAPPSNHDIEPAILKRVDRAETVMRGFEPRWREALCFFDNEQYVEVSAVTGELDRMETREGGNKPRWRPRFTRNRYTRAITSEIAVLISRMPGYEVMPMNGDPGPVAGARMGEKALLHMHDDLAIPGVTYDTLVYAANCGQGFTFPYWDRSFGTVIDVDQKTGAVTATGKIVIPVLAPWEVLYDPGTTFKESSYVCVRRARPVDEVREEYGLADYEVKPDAKGVPGERGEEVKDLVFVYEWLEKPSAQNQKGRWVVWAGNKELRAEEAYPCEEPEPVVHELAWLGRPHRHRPLGLGEQLVDVQRTFNRTINQIQQWQNLVLNPKILAVKGSLINHPTDKAGEVVEYRALGMHQPQWQVVPDIPVGLFQQLDRCIQDFEDLTGTSFPNDTEGGTHVQALNEREMNRRKVPLSNLAGWYASMGMHLLRLAQKYWTREQILTLNGRFGVSLIEGFTNADLEGIKSVRVSEASITPRTRASMEAKILLYADKGWIEPHQAMAALNGGTAEAIIDEFELDMSRQHREIELMLTMGEMDVPPDVAAKAAAEPEQGQYILEEFILATAPPVEEFDNHAIHMDVLRQYMKTRDWEDRTDAEKGILRAHYMLHENALREQMLMEQQAIAAAGEAKGTAGAAGIPQAPKGQPSEASMASQKEGLT
jgi:hypothetical protein